ncbi:MAG: small subunit ribosomal protein S20 [Candidatus Paceibacteria bacterium]|jgi:small subunit ribosomal protein S20
MAITQSAKKALRGSLKKAVFNTRRVRAYKTSEKEIEKLLLEGKVDEAKKALPNAYKAIDKAAKGKTLKKNTASRKKAKLSASIKRVDKK